MIPARIARQLEQKHGRLGAIRRATDRAQRYFAIEDGESIVTHPFRWLVWTTVLGILVGTPQSRVGEFLRHQTRRRAA